MGLNVSTSMGFEKQNMLRNTAREILSGKGASKEAASKILETTVFDSTSYVNPQLSIIKASSQISLNNSLNETLRYLKSHASKKMVKKVVLGELWDIISANNQASEENPYRGELYDFKIDYSAKNIFAA